MILKLTLEYEGTHYTGWQTQKRGRSVQDLVEGAIHGVTGEEVRVKGASRTDAGVHAWGQVATFKTLKEKSPHEWVRALNAHLPRDVVVVKACEVSLDFHPIKAATSKRYRYLIHNDFVRPALEAGRCWHVWGPLNVAGMRRAARVLSGRHDFAAFRASGSSIKDNRRTVGTVSIKRQGKKVVFEIEADGFLKYMVRNIVGTLVEVGRGRMTEEAFLRVLKGRDRKKAGATAPACGLYLVDIHYSSGGTGSSPPSSPSGPELPKLG